MLQYSVFFSHRIGSSTLCFTGSVVILHITAAIVYIAYNAYCILNHERMEKLAHPHMDEHYWIHFAIIK